MLSKRLFLLSLLTGIGAISVLSVAVANPRTRWEATQVFGRWVSPAQPQK